MAGLPFAVSAFLGGLFMQTRLDRNIDGGDICMAIPGELVIPDGRTPWA